jgi:hypothetical protein
MTTSFEQLVNSRNIASQDDCMSGPTPMEHQEQSGNEPKDPAQFLTSLMCLALRTRKPKYKRAMHSPSAHLNC